MSVNSVRTVRGGPRLIAALLATGLLLTGCADGAGDAERAGDTRSGPGKLVNENEKDAVGASASASSASDTGGGGSPGRGHAGAPAPLEAQAVEVREIPGLGPRTRAKIPAKSTQAVVVTGTGRDSNRSSVVIYERDPATGWSPASDTWPAHNAREGWTDDHSEGDLRSPIGVYDLTDAGGLLSDPGTSLPYDRDPAYAVSGTGFEGEALDGSFDYVVAINYNRVPGSAPLDWARPRGEEKGGGIWIHVDHGGPTQACVAVPRARMKELLRTLDPDRRPVVVMGDVASLER
jgi:L,D-peptidoglycan transpeptidase YkuD (ErfK/YbiS/YcfS/YnhG family)